MHSPRAIAARRSFAALTLASCILAAAGAASSCADDAARVGTSDIPRPARAAVPAAPVADDDARAPELATFDVAARVVDDLDGAIIGRPVTVVDARGKR